MSAPALSSQTTPLTATDEQGTDGAGTGAWAVSLILSLLLLGTIIFCVPQFLQKPLHEDPVYYTIQARTIQSGGVAYRELMEPNFPGVIWIHLGMYWLFGSSWIALRVLDLVLFTAFLGLLGRLLSKAGAKVPLLLALSLALLLYYFSLWRGVHCQRDVWMLVPSLLALQFRSRQLDRLDVEPVRSRGIVSGAVLEGVCWGMAVWIKPHVFLPALGCVLLSWLLARRKAPILRDALGLLTGGLFAGGLGVAWLIASGAWPYFWETMLEWNPEYARSGRTLFTAERSIFMTKRLLPWSLVHLAALPMAVAQVVNCLRSRSHSPHQAAAGLVSTLYLGWFLQAMLLQHLHDYAQLPAILLGVGVVAGFGLRCWPWQVVTTAVLSIALLASPVLKSFHWETWRESLNPSDRGKLRNRLVQISVPDWEDFELVAEYLETRNVRDGQVHCFHHLYFYDRLQIAPPIRFTYFPFRFQCNPSKRKEMIAALLESPHELVVSDLGTVNLGADALEYNAEAKAWTLGAVFPESLRNQYPWRLPVVFRSGTILVHQMPKSR